MKKKLLVLGGGNCQINLIKYLKNNDHTVIVSDYLANAPGRTLSDYCETVSTFNIDDNIEVAKKYNVDAVLTTGTDQPVYTAAYVSDVLNLPFPISKEVAKAVTNKKVMKSIFTSNEIPTVKYAFIKKDFNDEEISDFNFPVVIKPFDSQGQRGVLKLNSIKEIRNNINLTFNFTNEQEILIEEFYNSNEITVSGWVLKGKVYILSVTDRVTFSKGPHIGICKSHEFPSKFYNQYNKEIVKLTNNITHSFNIQNGPIYYQMLIGNEGIKVNEIACRIGGAFEDIYIPYLSGIDLNELLVKTTLKEPIDTKLLDNYSIDKATQKLSVQLFFANPGKICLMTKMKELINNKLIVNGLYNFSIGHTIDTISSASQRLGYMVITGKTNKELKANVNKVYSFIKVLDELGNNLIIH